jgi:hypothetical protein
LTSGLTRTMELNYTCIVRVQHFNKKELIDLIGAWTSTCITMLALDLYGFVVELIFVETQRWWFPWCVHENYYSCQKNRCRLAKFRAYSHDNPG